MSTPTLFAKITPAAPIVVDTRCGAVRTNDKQVYRCSRHGAHTRHIDYAHNVAWGQ